MNQKEIYQALKNKNLNASMIAEALGVSYQAVSNAIKQGKSSQRIASQHHPPAVYILLVN
nr:HTH domain-containing protein [Aggregatibacter actinomycetemcomitans]